MFKINRALLDEIILNCKQDFPNEACGILAGRDGIVHKIYPMANTERSPVRYLMEPKEQLMVMKEMRKENLEMIGIYHSHTASDAYPSKTDVEMAFYPDISHLIISLADMALPIVKSFKLFNGKIIEDTFSII